MCRLFLRNTCFICTAPGGEPENVPPPTGGLHHGIRGLKLSTQEVQERAEKDPAKRATTTPAQNSGNRTVKHCHTKKNRLSIRPFPRLETQKPKTSRNPFPSLNLEQAARAHPIYLFSFPLLHEKKKPNSITSMQSKSVFH